MVTPSPPDVSNDEAQPKRRPPISKELWLSALEVAAGILLGAVLYWQTGNTEVGAAASALIAAFGTLNGLHRIITAFETDKAMVAVQERLIDESNILRNEVVKLSRDVSTRVDDLSRRIELDEISRLYWRIDSELDADRARIVEGARDELRTLTHTRTSSLMRKGEYYRWIDEQMRRLARGSKVMAVSRMRSSEWDDSAEERNFFANNLRIAQEGGTVDRIFIMPRSAFETIVAGRQQKQSTSALDAAKVLMAHSTNGVARIDGRLVDEDHLARNDRVLLDEIGDGFLILRDSHTNRTVAIKDEFHDNEARGKATLNEGEVGRLLGSFRKLWGMSEPIGDFALIRSRLSTTIAANPPKRRVRSKRPKKIGGPSSPST